MSLKNEEASGSRSFNYALNDRKAKKKILEGAKRPPFEVDENLTSDTLIFSAGAWLQVVLPFLDKLKEDIDKTFSVSDTKVKVNSVVFGREASDMKYVDAKVVLTTGKDRIVCHFYNTTQRVLINGHGYKKIVNSLLTPLFAEKIELLKEEIKKANSEITENFDSKAKSVKRSTVKYNGRTPFSCSECDHASKSLSALSKHKQMNHSMQISSSLKTTLTYSTSTRNNSVCKIS